MLFIIGSWKSLAFRGVAAVVFGIMASVWPAITALALVFLFGIYALTDGIFNPRHLDCRVLCHIVGSTAAGTCPPHQNARDSGRLVQRLRINLAFERPVIPD
ncbi:MAG: DUF308 domain-containing protein, partial [Actinomycetota bacterium]